MAISYNSATFDYEMTEISTNLKNANEILTSMVQEIEGLVQQGLLKASESDALVNSIKLKANRMTSEMNDMIAETKIAYQTTAQNIINASKTNASNIPY